MGCTNCGKTTHHAAPPVHKVRAWHEFGRCPRCFFLSILVMLASILPVAASLFVSLPRTLRWIVVLPLVLSTAWLVLHVIGYLRHRQPPAS